MHFTFICVCEESDCSFANQPKQLMVIIDEVNNIFNLEYSRKNVRNVLSSLYVDILTIESTLLFQSIRNVLEERKKFLVVFSFAQR